MSNAVATDLSVLLADPQRAADVAIAEVAGVLTKIAAGQARLAAVQGALAAPARGVCTIATGIRGGRQRTPNEEAASRGLKALEASGLVHVDRGRGRTAVVTVLEAPAEVVVDDRKAAGA
jgi:hypothetical protein